MNFSAWEHKIHFYFGFLITTGMNGLKGSEPCPLGACYIMWTCPITSEPVWNQFGTSLNVYSICALYGNFKVKCDLSAIMLKGRSHWWHNSIILFFFLTTLLTWIPDFHPKVYTFGCGQSAPTAELESCGLHDDENAVKIQEGSSSLCSIYNLITALPAASSTQYKFTVQLCQPVYDNRCRPFVSPESPASPRPSDLHTTGLSRAPAAYHRPDPVSVCFLWRLTTLFWQKGLDFL